ncbi:Uncharacterised protein [Mycobacterium tuberculosis]|nr:Uncharacterised protein [Mycobacterium tuberculosis]
MHRPHRPYPGDVDRFEVVAGAVGTLVRPGPHGDGRPVGGLGGVLDEFAAAVNPLKVVGVCLIGLQ